MNFFAGKKAIVVGASSGIGRAVALKLAAEGASVALSYHSGKEAAQQLADDIASRGGTAFPFVLNLGDPQVLEAQFDHAVDKLGRLDVLVNSAGQWMKKTPIAECENELWDHLIMVNLTSVFRLCRKAARLMLSQGCGSIVNVSSVVARTGGSGGTVPYCVTKAGINTFTRGLARELAGRGIRVNAVAPGLVDTPMLDQNFDAQGKSNLVEAIPLKRMARPEELADAVLFLASEAASYITGEILEVNGGILMD